MRAIEESPVLSPVVCAISTAVSTMFARSELSLLNAARRCSLLAEGW